MIDETITDWVNKTGNEPLFYKPIDIKQHYVEI